MPLPRSFVPDAILTAGFMVGVLDIGDAIAVTWLLGGSPLRMLQGIASGIVGASAFTGGTLTALLGLGIHFFIAYAVAAIYVLASLRLPVLIRRAIPCSLAYGLAVHAVMKLVVLPLAGFGPPRWTLISIVNGVGAHLLFVGLPIGLATRRAARGCAGVKL